MGSKRHMECECLTDVVQIGIIGLKVLLGVYSLSMVHHRGEALIVKSGTVFKQTVEVYIPLV